MLQLTRFVGKVFEPFSRGRDGKTNFWSLATEVVVPNLRTLAKQGMHVIVT